MLGLSNWTTSDTVGALVTRSKRASSLNKPGRKSRWLYSGRSRSSGFLKNDSANRSPASTRRATVAASRALRTTRKPSSSKARRCSGSRGIKSIGILLSDDTAMLHLVIDGRQYRSVRKQGLHVFLGVKDMTGPLAPWFVESNILSLDI